MRRTFLIRLFLLLLTVFAAMGAGTYVHMLRHADERAEQMMAGRLNDLAELLVHEDECENTARELYEETALHRAHAAAELLQYDPRPAQQQERLQELCNLMGAEQVFLTDAEGKVVAAVPAVNIGLRLKTDERLSEFAICAEEKTAEICRTIRPIKEAAALMQYAGVHRLDGEGGLLLGFSTHRLHRTRSNEALARLADHYHMGQGGFIVAFRGGALLNKSGREGNVAELLSVPLDCVGRMTLEEADYFTYAVENRDYRLVALLPAEEVYKVSMKTLRSLLLSNLCIFIIMFVAVSYMLQRYVLRGLSRVISSLRRITDGDLTERVEVNDTQEFRRLSADINAMVDTLRYYGEEEKADMERELELARSIQSAALPSQFPAFPTRTEFDLFASCVPAAGVGGDFYDFFMPDADRLCFVVADLSENGIPAALYMMRCMSLIRSVARSGLKPGKLARAVNKALCEGQTTGIRLSLFYGSLRISTGSLRYINAGAPQALLQHDGETYGDMPLEAGPPLGLTEDAEYRENRLTLKPGDRLVLWTEGVTESHNAENVPFGRERLTAALNEPAVTVTDLVHQTRAAIRRHLNGAAIDSDVTLLALEYRSKKHAKGAISLKAGEPEALQTLCDTRLEAVFAAPPDIADIKAAAGAVLNALPADCTVSAALTCDETQADLELRYAEPRFNPLISLPHLPVDTVAYDYSETAGNTLTLYKKLS